MQFINSEKQYPHYCPDYYESVDMAGVKKEDSNNYSI